MRGSAARGVLSGAVAGAGAWVAHTVSGGEVTPTAGLVALALALALGPLLLAPSRTSPRSPERAAAPADPLRVAALMLATQGVWHLVFMVGAAPAAALPANTPAATSAGPEHTALMLAAHLLVAFAATTVAVGLDQALVQAAVRVTAALLPRPVVDVTPLPVPNRPAPVRTAAPPPLTSARLLLTRVLRGPPTGALPVR
ncbi:hypothetical protein G7072_18090 [Nocardioides sp. HDW12B]|uniref:hypothetical protein n=1 Tax=Nocardioides sp. HDW12B TaxID=2714939 RepID=UPI00140CB3B4|nr:hypothetical protein [Nocardioides sp. HDW12B]QIK67998.1 hypothetical protein G7072_18090 [Nocardioides sp. HDW12B]